MERGKSGMGRGGKSKLPQHPAEVYALGSKAGETKRTVPVPHPKPGASHSLPGDRKREGVASSSLVPPKKPKLAHSSSVVSGGVVRSSPVTTPDNSDAWEASALEFEPADFITLISDASNTNDHDKIIGYICGAVKTLKQQRYKPDASLIQSLIYLSKIKSPVFTNELITGALCSILRRDTNHSFKSKNALLPVLAVNLLMKGYLDNKRWPEMFVKLFIEDSLGERLWVDHENCKSFVDNIMTAFSTKATPTLELEGRLEPAEDPDAATVNTGPSSAVAKEIYDSIPVVNRFTTNQEPVEATVLEVVRENLSRRQAPDSITRNFLKLLAAASGIVEVRVLVATRLEVWLQNPKLQRPAQELLMSVCVNCTGHTQKDVEVISALVKIRLKSKAVVNYYLACIRELIIAHSDNLGTVLKHTIYNELSQSRNPNNLSMLAVMFQYDPDMAASILADIFQELLLNRDDYLRPLRALLREIWRALRSDLNLAALSRGLMSQTEPLPRDCEFSQRAFSATADLITLCMFLAVATHARPDKKEPHATLEKMQQTIAGIQNDSVWWLQETALRIYRPSASDFVHALHKVLLMEPLDQYYKLDNWPPESDRMQFMRLASEVPLLQHILLRVLMIGLSKEHPLAAAEAVELADQLVKRAANIASSDNNGHMLVVDKMEIFELIFNLSAYHHPENIDLPAGYKPPTLAITNLYWKGWALLLVLSAHNPTTVGAEGWNKYPTLRTLMEMCITNHFIFPQAPEELQLLTLEKEAILQFETHLAAASTKMEITEQSSLLLSQLMSMDVKGDPRRPPPVFIDQLVNLNSSLRLGHLLCRSRQPDFLLDIIQLQGPSQSMPWLADLVHSSDASLNHLPVQCLCEFVLSSGARQQNKYQQLLTHLQNLLTEPTQDAEIVCEILDYFLRRLSSPRNREQAIAGLKLVLGCAEEEVEEGRDDATWLMRQLPLLPHFQLARTQIVVALRSACLIESEPSLVVMYLNFLAQHNSNDLSELTDLVADMATLIVERSTIINAIVPSQDEPNPALDAFLSMFYSYLIKAREPQREAYTWSESQDQIRVTWLSGEHCILYILVVHAMVIILAFGPQAVTLNAEYQHLLDAWFPVNRDETPKAFLVDTSEEALLIPDWLKLRMIRSRVSRLVNAALTDLEPQQLILFIQSFGIPVASMSKLLETLDHAVLTDELAVAEAIQDKAYMTQLVEVQHRRGAVGGDIFSRVLGGQDKAEPAQSSLTTPMDVSSESVPTDPTPTVHLSETKIIPVVENLFLLPENRQMSRAIFLTLQKTLSTELTKSRTSKEPSRVLKVLIVYLMKRTSSDKNFVRAMISRLHIACPLFRLLASVSREDLLPTLLLIAQVVLSEAQVVPAAKPLVNILKNFINKHESTGMSGLRTSSSSGDMIQVFDEAPLLQLEARGHSLLESPALRVHGPESLVQALTSLLLRNDKATDNRKGLLIDWLVQLQPEIISTSSKAQLDLLFSRGEFSCRPYLLTLLTHHASWGTINLCVKQLLDPAVVTVYDPTAVLDFLIALTCNPKLLQGREKFALKNGAREDILELPLHQLKCITEYIVEEAVRVEDIKTAVDKMNLRLCLLAPHADLATLSVLVTHLRDNAGKPTGKHSEMCRQLLVQLYLRVPSIITQLSDTELTKYLNSSPISVMGSSVLDSMSHTLLTALTATPPSKDWVRKSQDLDLAARKMTATHPLLVLRQLTMLSSALRGRVHLEFPVFRSRNHLALFNQVLGLLELLKPHLFRPEYTEPLHAMFDTYFQLFKRYGHMKDVAAMLTRFVNLLRAYIGHNAEEALRYLQTQAQLISELQNQHHSLGSVCIMMSGVRDRESAGGGEVLVSAPTPPDSLPPQWDNILLALKHSDALMSLQDLDQVTLRRPALLAQTVNDLAELIQSPSSAVRSLAHGLLARYLRHAPDTALTLLPAYLACLNSGDCELVSSLLDRLPEIIVCSQEVAQPLLETVFCLGLTQNMSTLQAITKSLSLLNLQIGC